MMFLSKTFAFRNLLSNYLAEVFKIRDLRKFDAQTRGVATVRESLYFPWKNALTFFFSNLVNNKGWKIGYRHDFSFYLLITFILGRLIASERNDF